MCLTTARKARREVCEKCLLTKTPKSVLPRVLEASRQTVKDLVKRELGTESVSSDLLNLRLRV